MIGEIGTHPKDGKPMLLVEAQEEWRAWLKVKHEESSGVWLVSWKKATERPYVPFSDVVDEALCFGWVDSKINRLDEERAMRLFTPRNLKSPWSRINKEKVARLVEDGRMAAAGMRLVEGAKVDGSWNTYDEIEDLVVPPDLASALGKNDSHGRGLFHGLPRLVEEEHSVVDKVGAEAGDAGDADREDGRDGGGEPDGESSGGTRRGADASFGVGGCTPDAKSGLHRWCCWRQCTGYRLSPV